MQPNSQSSIMPNAASELRRICRQLARQLASSPRRWQVCPQRACRRHRRCVSLDLACVTKVLSPEQQAATLAELQRALETKA